MSMSVSLSNVGISKNIFIAFEQISRCRLYESIFFCTSALSGVVSIRVEFYLSWMGV